MSDIKRLYYTTTTIVHAVVADSPEKACVIADSAVESTLVNDNTILRNDVTAVLATDLRGEPWQQVSLPEWEYPLPEESHTIEDPDAIAEAEHSQRRWTIAMWVREQARLAPIDTPAAPVVSINDDWRGPPSPAEVKAHHEAHANADGCSVWHMLTSRETTAAIAIAINGVFGFLPHEATRWRPADSRQTPVAWSTPRGER